MNVDGAGSGPGQPPARDRITRAFFVLWLVCALALCAMRAARPGLEIGDGQNDGDILHASRYFDEHGYRETHFLPTRETSVPRAGRPELYNTFPPGVFYIHELLKAVGLRELWAFRVASVLWGQAAVWLFFALARRLTRSALIGALAATLYMLSAAYTDFAGGLWEHLPMLTLFGTLASWLAFEDARGARARAGWLAAATACAFFDSWLTVQHALMIGVFIGARAAWAALSRVRAGDARGALSPLLSATLVCIMPLPILAIRFAHQVIAGGGMAEAVGYFQRTLFYRGGFGEASVTRGRAISTCLRRIGAPAIAGFAGEAGRYNFPAFTIANLAIGVGIVAAMVFAGAWGRRRDEFKPVRAGLLAGGLLLLGALTWPLAMAGHAKLHLFVVLMFMPAACLVLASLAAAGPLLLGSARPPPRRLSVALVVAGAALVALTVRDVYRSELLNAFVPLKRGVYTRVEHDRARFEIMGKAGRHLTELAPASGPRTLRVSPRWPSIPYYLDQPFYSLPLPSEIPFNPAEIIMVDLTYPKTVRAGGSLAAHLGVPDTLTRPGGLGFFPALPPPLAPGAVLQCVDKEAVGGVLIREARWAPTLDGGAWTLGLALDGSLSAVEADRMRVFLTVVGRNGAPLWVAGPEVARTCRGAFGALVLVEVPLAVGSNASTITTTIEELGGRTGPLSITIDAP